MLYNLSVPLKRFFSPVANC